MLRRTLERFIRAAEAGRQLGNQGRGFGVHISHMKTRSRGSVRLRSETCPGLAGAVGAVALGLSTIALPAAAAPEHQAFQVGSYIRVTPSLASRVEYDDNIFKTQDNEKSDVITRVDPALDVDISLGGSGNGLSLAYHPKFGLFASNQDDSVVDHDLQAKFLHEGEHLTSRLRAGYVLGHDARGDGPSNGLGSGTTRVFDKPPEYTRKSWGGSIGNADRDVRTHVSLDYDHQGIRYDNFRAITRARDHETDRYKVELGYEIGPKTYAILNTSLSRFDYSYTPPGVKKLDSDEWRYQAGLEWDVTSKTKGRATFGWQKKDYDASTLGSDSGASWDVGITWKPISYAQIDLTARRAYRETDREGSAVLTSNYGVSVQQDWNSRLSSKASVEYLNEDFRNATREDKSIRTSLQVDYDFRRWMTLGAGYQYDVRDSNLIGADYTRNMVFLKANFGL